MNRTITNDQPLGHQATFSGLALMLIAMSVAAGCAMEPGLADETHTRYDDTFTVKKAPDWPQRPADEVFTFSTETDVISLVMASDGLFASIPAGITTLDEPEIDNGFLGSFKMYRKSGHLVGFGTKHEELLLPTPISLTTYMLTLPGRGTLALEAVQDVTPFYQEIEDMLSSGHLEDLIRSWDPPLTIVTTVPETGRIIGGTGEFADASGVWRETQALHELDLIERTLVDTLTFEIWLER